MRSRGEDNRRLVTRVGQYMKGETAMETIARRRRLFVVREILGLQGQEGIWCWGRHWRGRCLEAGVDPESFEVIDQGLFETWWAYYDAQYGKVREKRQERKEARREKKFGELQVSEKWEEKVMPEEIKPSSSAVFKLPKF